VKGGKKPQKEGEQDLSYKQKGKNCGGRRKKIPNRTIGWNCDKRTSEKKKKGGADWPPSGRKKTGETWHPGRGEGRNVFL